MLHCRTALPLTLLAALCLPAHAQSQEPQEPPPPAPVNNAPPASAVAATVNGQEIPELAVFRALEAGKVPLEQRDEIRKDIIRFLADNALVDQYLDQLKVDVGAKEVDAQVDKVKAEIKDQGKDLDTVLKILYLTEADLRVQVKATLRWDKFMQQYAPEKTLKEFFESNKVMFDGSQVRAKHILINVPAGDSKAAEAAKAKIAELKKQIEDKVAKGLADAGALDNLERETKRRKLLAEVFAETASKESACPSKSSGGELLWFPRIGGRVAEPFAQAAFALKPGEMSDAVVTEFGYHLILVTDTKPGVERKFEDVKDVVKDVYADRMREAILQRMKPAANIVVNAAPK
jgi:peptidyl-prolyl cis-trans isomerase C